MTRGNVVRARLTLRYGTQADFTNRALAASIIDDVICAARRSTPSSSSRSVGRARGAGQLHSPPGELDVSIQTTRDNLAAVLELVDEVLRQPSFPQDQFDIMVKEALARSREQKRIRRRRRS